MDGQRGRPGRHLDRLDGRGKVGVEEEGEGETVPPGKVLNAMGRGSGWSYVKIMYYVMKV